MWTSRATLYDLSTQAHAQSAVGVYARHRSVGILRHLAYTHRQIADNTEITVFADGSPKSNKSAEP